MLTFAGPQPNNMPPFYDRDVLYTINISNAGARTDPEIQIRARFGFDGQSPGVQFTGIPGKYVKLEETISSFERLVAGEFDNLPEQAFFMAGGIDDVVANAKKLQG